MKKLKITIFLILLITAVQMPDSYGLTDTAKYPVIGKLVPYDTIGNYNGNQSESYIISENKALPTIVIFWAYWCVPCIKNLPKENEMFLANKEKVNMVLVAPFDQQHLKIFEVYKKKFNLSIPSCFDTNVFDSRQSNAISSPVWIDKNGVVRNIGPLNDTSKFEKFLNGEPIDQIKESVLFNSKSSSTGGHSSGLLRTDIISEWREGMHSTPIWTIDNEANRKHGKIEFAKSRLDNLYKLAYLGKVEEVPGFYDKVIVETGNPEPFGDSMLYSYSQKIDEGVLSKEELMEQMQRDLKLGFGYNATIENRSVPCLKISLTDEKYLSLLQSKGGQRKITSNPLHLSLRNAELIELLVVLEYQFGKEVVNETELDEGVKIDIDLNGEPLWDYGTLADELKRNGLKLVESTVFRKALVIHN